MSIIDNPLLHVFGGNALSMLFDNFLKRSKPRITKMDSVQEELKSVNELLAMMGRKATPTMVKADLGTPSKLDLPTTAETIQELRRRLGIELYQFQGDLLNRCKIAGKPCDCCGSKHPLGLEAMASELQSMNPDPLWDEVITWVRENSPKLTREASASGQYDDWYVKDAAPKMRDFRKRTLGTAAPETMVPANVPEHLRQRAKELAEQVKAHQITREEAIEQLKGEIQ